MPSHCTAKLHSPECHKPTLNVYMKMSCFIFMVQENGKGKKKNVDLPKKKELDKKGSNE